MSLQTSVSAVLTNAQGHQRYGGWLSNDYYYDRYRVIVSQMGYYAFTSAGGLLDMYGYFYRTVFNPNSSSTNLMGMDRGSRGNNQFKIHINLLLNMTYELVVTTFYPDRTGNYTINVFGLSPVGVQKIDDSTATATTTTTTPTTTVTGVTSITISATSMQTTSNNICEGFADDISL